MLGPLVLPVLLALLALPVRLVPPALLVLPDPSVLPGLLALLALLVLPVLPALLVRPVLSDPLVLPAPPVPLALLALPVPPARLALPDPLRWSPLRPRWRTPQMPRCSTSSTCCWPICVPRDFWPPEPLSWQKQRIRAALFHYISI